MCVDSANEPQPPPQAYGGGYGGYYGGQQQPQPVYIQRPQNNQNDMAQGCCACLAGLAACWCLEEICMNAFLF